MEQQFSPPTPTASQVNMGKWISEGWRIVESDLGFFFLLSLIYSILLAVVSCTAIGAIILTGPLTVGFFYIIFQKMRGQPVDIGGIGKGFDFFAASVLASVITSVFITIGFIFCILPGIVLMALYMFTLPFVLEKKLDFWQAMEASRQVIKQHWFEFSVFVLVQAFILFLGILCCFIGIFVAMPVCFAATAAAYRDMVGLENPDADTPAVTI